MINFATQIFKGMSKEYTTELLIDFGPDGSSLLPVVTQDFKTKEVLILSFVNKQAFDETLRSGYATYWSRSRNELWKKVIRERANQKCFQTNQSKQEKIRVRV